MRIEVIKPKKFLTHVLEFDLQASKNKLTLSDGEGRDTTIRFRTIGTLIPSTLFSRWLSYHKQKELLTLQGLGSSVQYGKEDWKFRDNPKIFGLHDTVNSKGEVISVRIDDSIGMKKVVAIANALGYTVHTEFDVDTYRMKKIVLEKEM